MAKTELPKNLHLFVTAALYKAAKAHADREHLTFRALVEKALQSYLKEKKNGKNRTTA